MKSILYLFFITVPLFTNAQLFEERNGIVAVEAENFFRQSDNRIRHWEIIAGTGKEGAVPDALTDAGGRKYLQVLPDTRVTKEDKLIAGENFSNQPGMMAVISYRIWFNSIGKYYVWVRAFSTGAEDNGIHAGLDGEWPESGQRMQWCEGKNQWTWASRQRTEAVHCGEEQLIYLDIKTTGEHVVSFSMREDGFRFDKFILSAEYRMPEGTGYGVLMKQE